MNSKRWLQEHFSDKYVKQAQKSGLRSRAWFKLAEIQQSYNIFKPGITVVELGSAHGGWSQYVTAQIGCKGRLIACDILPMAKMGGVEFLQGDFSDSQVLQTMLERVGEHKVQVVLSDIAPNMSGISAIDVTKSMYMVELALEMCIEVIAQGGTLLVKTFSGLDSYMRKISSRFKKVKIMKPYASRKRSRELYVVATGRKL